jgi:hypothetical protein
LRAPMRANRIISTVALNPFLIRRPANDGQVVIIA